MRHATKPPKLDLVGDMGSTLPVMVGLALLAVSLSLVLYDTASAFAFQQRLQFYADQTALAAAGNSQDLPQLIKQFDESIWVDLSAAQLSRDSGQASVQFCSLWQPKVKLPFVGDERRICVTASAR
jgi:hypothetical protein